MSTRSGLAALLLVVVGCATAPLGDDWEGLSQEAKDARALDALEELFAARSDETGNRVPDRAVVSIDLTGIVYDTEGAATSRLRWQDIDLVERDDRPGEPARPEDLRVYLTSPSQETVLDQVEPVLARTGLFRRYLLLRMRPRGSRARLMAALQHVRSRTRPVLEVAPIPSAAVATPASPSRPETPAARLEEAEQTLRRLRAWREEGLITEEEYEARKRAVLDGL
jgi:hypothetical protein